MKRTLTVFISCLAALSLFTTASAAKQPNYRKDYNATLTAYQDLTSSAQFHNHYAKTHKGKCAKEMSQSWVASTKTDITNVTNLANQLVKSWKQDHGKHIYLDSLKAARDVKTWGHGKVQVNYGTCKPVPTSSSTVNRDIDNLDNDLGIPQIYGVQRPRLR